MITAQIKDKILFNIVESANTIRLEINVQTLSNKLDVNSDIICAVIEYFERKGFCHINNKLGCYGSEKYDITLHVEAYDMYRNGGFVFLDDIMKTNLSKLELELSLLSKKASGDFLDRLQKMSSIVGSLLSAFPFINR